MLKKMDKEKEDTSPQAGGGINITQDSEDRQGVKTNASSAFLKKMGY